MMSNWLRLCVLCSFVITMEASSVLTDTKFNISRDSFQKVGNQNNTDVFRQLLNQEMLIRMSLSKDVHMLMKEMVDLKTKQTKLESKISELENENQNLRRTTERLKKEGEKVKEEIEKVNDETLNLRRNVSLTSEDTSRDITAMNKSQHLFQKELEKSKQLFEKNTSDILADLKIELRYMSVTLLDLNKHTLEIDKKVPKLVEEKFESISEHTKTLIEILAQNQSDVRGKQNKLATAVSDLEKFRSTITDVVAESLNKTIFEMKEDIHETQDKLLKHEISLSTLELFKMNISNTKSARTRVGFTAGITSSSSVWTGGTLVFPKMIFDVGGGYNAATGVFTAPIGGDYVFYLSAQSYSSGDLVLDIKLNGVGKVSSMSERQSDDIYQTGTNLVLLRLKQGDRVYVTRRYGRGYYSTTIPVTTFTGFLL